MLQKNRTFPREMDFARAALKEPMAQPILQFPDGVAHGTG
jgi:hypothetical protein